MSTKEFNRITVWTGVAYMFLIDTVILKRLLKPTVAWTCLYTVLLANAFADEGKPAGHVQTDGQVLYAKVGDREITVEEYNQTYARTMRQRYYHSKPPEAELALVRQEIADELITRQLLLLEAARSGMKPDEESIQATLQQYDQRYASSPRWQQERARLLGSLKVKLEEDDLLRQLESKVKRQVSEERVTFRVTLEGKHFLRSVAAARRVSVGRILREVLAARFPDVEFEPPESKPKRRRK
jgi:hypothetical protein